MKSGSKPHPIPPGLLEQLGPPDKSLHGQRCWLLASVAAAVKCTTAALRNWLGSGRIIDAVYHAGAWYLPESTLRSLAANGLPATGTYPPLKINQRYDAASTLARVFPDPCRSAGGCGRRQS